MSEEVSESVPHNAIYGPMSAGIRRSFGNHAPCGRHKTGSFSKHTMYEGKRGGLEGDSFGNHGKGRWEKGEFQEGHRIRAGKGNESASSPDAAEIIKSFNSE